MASAHFPQSNSRAEVAVKSAKPVLMSNTSPTGSLDHDQFLRAMLQLHNTPDPDSNISPAQIIFGRPLRDTLSFLNRLEKFSNPNVRPLWRQAWAAKEEALRSRIPPTTESLKEHSRPLRPLALGERVFIQTPPGHQPQQMRQIRDCCPILRPPSVPGKGRRFRTHHVTQSSFPPCLYPG